MALYRVYDIFDRIKSRLKTAKRGDLEVLRKLKAGEILRGDHRFDQIRNPGKDKNQHKAIALNESDSKWLADTHFGKFIVIESELLPKLKDEVESRVIARKEGSAAIFGVP
jgi:hypothetical protein